ncbi:hypothetical protein EJB05_46396 [Eragrostis curvula]|uniref:Peptidase C1A papain C-terminal domain-containing protein n=1 Tax=Eragrostis curvula TaxID=38414 RepID=A0A5J9TN52_9POAL|nr:hypothetical protein EJB05_46396 [Eragrostis curvula]
MYLVVKASTPAKGQLKSLQLLICNNHLTSSISAEYASRSFQIIYNFTASSSTGCHPIKQPRLLINRGDKEFSWHENTLYGKKITPRIQFLTDSFIQDYENIAGGALGSADDKFRTTRRKEALKMFVRDGVLAKEANGSVRRIRLSGYEWKHSIDFDEVGKIIRQGKPLVGSVPIDSNFAALKGREIYDYNPKKAKKTMGGASAAHAVLFIGFELRGGRTYLVFLNSHGKRFGEKGIGRGSKPGFGRGGGGAFGAGGSSME